MSAKTLYCRLFSLIILLCMAWPCGAAFRNLSVTDGLSDLLVNAIYRDKEGFVWLGTGSSLERFDGIHLHHYPISGEDEKLKRVNTIAELPDKSLWMGNGTGLWRLDRTTDRLEAYLSETIKGAVYDLLPDPAHTDIVYIATMQGLYVWHDGETTHHPVNPNVLSAANNVYALLLDEERSLWMATAEGLYVWHPDKPEEAAIRQNETSLPPCAYHDIVRIGERLYLATMEHGLVSFDLKSGLFARSVDVGCNVISSLAAGTDGALYVGTDGAGVCLVDTEHGEVVRSWRHRDEAAAKGEASHEERVTEEAALSSNSVYSLLVDEEGLMWVGFYQQGVDYTLYQDSLFGVYTYDNRLDTHGMPVRALCIRGQERLIGSRSGLYYVDESRRLCCSYNVPRLRSDMIFSILFHHGRYYIGSYGGGLYVLDPQTLAVTPVATEAKHIFCLKQDAEGDMWAGTSMGILRFRDGVEVARYTSANSRLPEGNVYEIYFDSTGKGWLCTESGMALWNPGTQRIVTDCFPEGFIHREKVRVVYEDSDRKLYFFPDKGAMLVTDLSMTTFSRIGPGTPLEGLDGMFIIEDREGYLWIGTTGGLFRYDKEHRFIPYGYADGIPSPIFTLCLPLCDEEGRLWLGNSKGVLCISPERMQEREKNHHKVTVTDVLVNGKESVQPQHGEEEGAVVHLLPSQGNVTILFSDFAYTLPEESSHEYLLEGHDSEWQRADNRSGAIYYNLPAGKYRFHVRRIGREETTTSLTIDIASPWLSRTGWGALLLAIGGLAVIAYVWAKRRRLANVNEVGEETTPATAMTGKYKSVRISEEERIRLQQQLEAYMHNEKPYTNPDLKIADLASALGTTAHTLSYIFNSHLGCSYYDYVNDFRIAEFKRMVASGEYTPYTLTALAELCGFSSRASFFRYFKKVTGITPSDYIKGKEKQPD